MHISHEQRNESEAFVQASLKATSPVSSRWWASSPPPDSLPGHGYGGAL